MASAHAQTRGRPAFLTARGAVSDALIEITVSITIVEVDAPSLLCSAGWDSLN